jgi:HK97 family phage portal protein
MSLLKQYLAGSTVSEKVNDGGLAILEKSYYELGSVTSVGVSEKENILVQQKVRAQYLKMLFSMSPSANQAAEKIVTCIMSDGWLIRPKDKTKKEDKKKILSIKEECEDLYIDDVIKTMVWSYLMYGDVAVYTPKGSGEYKDKARALIVLDNQFLSIEIDRKLYEETGVPIINGYKYEVSPIDGTVNSIKRKIVEYKTDEIIRWSRATAFNRVIGTAPLEEDQATLTLGIKVLNHNLRFFLNNTKPPLVISLGEGTNVNSAMEYKKVLDSRYKGSNNAFETLVTWGNTEVKELSLPDTTAFYDMLTYVRIQVCGLMGVPPNEIGVTDKSGLNTSETAHKDFIKTNINARKLELGKLLTRELLNKKMGHDDYEFWFPPMDAINEKQRAETNTVMLESGQITPDEARELLGYDTTNEEWTKLLYFGNMKGIKGLVPFDKGVKKDFNAAPAKDNGRTGKNSKAPKKNSGRVDGKTKEPNSGMNADTGKK